MKIGTTVTPITTDADYAPVDLLHIIKCNCKSSNACSTNVCTCRKHGIPCLPACGECRGDNCSNTQLIHNRNVLSYETDLNEESEKCDEVFDF